MSPERQPGASAPGTPVLGMIVFLAAVSMLFAACIAGYVVIRLRAETWPPPGSPGLPETLWLSTALALACSAAVQAAQGAVRRDDQRRLRRWLMAATGLGLLFVASQSWSLWQVMGEAAFRSHLYGFTFVMMTGLHGAHVLGGIVGLIVVWLLARRGNYAPGRDSGVRNCAIYWHYLTGVWVVLLVLLLLG